MELLSSPSCSSPLRQAASLLAVLCILLQMVTVIFLPRLNLATGWGMPHLGLMHLVATDIVLWIRIVLQVPVQVYPYSVAVFRSRSTSSRRRSGRR